MPTNSFVEGRCQDEWPILKSKFLFFDVSNATNDTWCLKVPHIRVTIRNLVWKILLWPDNMFWNRPNYVGVWRTIWPDPGDYASRINNDVTKGETERRILCLQLCILLYGISWKQQKFEKDLFDDSMVSAFFQTSLYCMWNLPARLDKRQDEADK